MKMALELYPRVKFIIECDADGSHRVEDILKLMQSENTADLIIGSRYLDESQIIGWPVSRRIFSFCLNILIPKLVHVPVQDITNGLRRYTTDTTRKILENPQRNLGFIYLSEQAIIVERSGLSISEIPITFIDRTLGKSTVTWREIYGSIVGITQLITVKSTIKK
jgi:dolichol-phosphate mannosyltransferase